MKKISFIAVFALVCNFAIAQIQQTAFRGAFAPAPTAMWTQGWTNFDPNAAVYADVTTPVTADITSNVTWTKDKVYELTRLITVRNNATLTIQAGTVIRSNALASALVITRGAKLIANGTAAEPIVFTSKNTAGSRSRGNWGGIVILGKARYNVNNGVNYIEGISQNINTEFGGGLTPDDNDNSGSLKYVRIEFAGFVFSPNNELNGLTLGAVGKGTTIEHVQVSYSNDDSFEWFGGSVNCKYLVAFNGLDDDFDVDNGFKGIVQFGLSIKDPSGADISTSEAFEVDNNAAATATTVTWGDTTSPIFSNITCVGPLERAALTNATTLNSFHDKSLRLRRASAPQIFNSIFVGHAKGLVINDQLTAGNAIAGTLKFKNNLIASALPLQATSGINATTSGSNPVTTGDIATWFATPAFDNKTYANSTGLLTRPYDTTNGQNYAMIVDNNDTVNCDLRPASIDATTGASFTDAAFNNLITISGAPGVTPRTYCQGEVAPALTANLTATGVSLRWYTTATATIFTTVAPIPTTSVAGTKSYFVAEVDALGAVSSRAAVLVTTNASPTVALGTITSTFTADGAVATTNVGPQIGTTTEFTYTIPAVVGATSYFWTVPLGATIVSGQGTNTISVNYANVASGVFKVGNVTVQAANAANGEGCRGRAKTLAISATLPIAPAAITMTDAALPLVLNAITNVSSPRKLASFAAYMGTTTPLTLTATAVPAARVDGYVWELPAGVNLLNIGTQVDANGALAGLDLVLNFNSYPFTVPVSVPGAGNVYYQITTKLYSSGTRIVTGRIIQNARPATGNLPAIVAFNRELTNLTNEGVPVYPAFPTTYSTNVITVNFAGVTAANTHAYVSGTGVNTNSMRIGVIAGNRVGASVTNNAAAINPTTTSTARLLTLTAVVPAAPARVTGQIAALCGGSSSYNYTITPSALASSYAITAPAGSVVTANSKIVTYVATLSGANEVPANASAATGTATLAFNTATKMFTVIVNHTAVSPTAGHIHTGAAGTNGGVAFGFASPVSPISYTSPVLTDAQILDLEAGNLYVNLHSAAFPGGEIRGNLVPQATTANTLRTSDLMFTVMYPAGFVATVAAPQSLLVSAVNGVGTSALSRTLVLSTLVPAVGAITSTTGNITQFNQSLTAKVFTVPTNVLYTGYTWTASNGAVITAGQGTNTITVDFSGVVGTLSTTSSIITVVGTNGCTSSAVKSTTLKYNASALRLRQETVVNATEVYPNPVTSVMNVDVTSSAAGVLDIAIYSLDGTVAVSAKSIALKAGVNTITENVSSLNKGIYVVQLVNSSNGEVITKKLIKN
jgi:hypothetical protein